MELLVTNNDSKIQAAPREKLFPSYIRDSWLLSNNVLHAVTPHSPLIMCYIYAPSPLWAVLKNCPGPLPKPVNSSLVCYHFDVIKHCLCPISRFFPPLEILGKLLKFRTGYIWNQGVTVSFPALMIWMFDHSFESLEVEEEQDPANE